MANSDKYNAHFQRLLAVPRVLRSYRISLEELLFLISFPINFVAGKIIHWTGPKEEVYNYYNNKSNVFNQVFVKRGWFWTTVVVLVFYGALFTAQNHPLVKTNYRQRLQLLRRILVRYVVMTIWWVLFTQWCFGLPLMDKIFVYSGGKCAGIPNAVGNLDLFTPSAQGYESTKISSYTCRRLKGSWEGGHDPSGHVFLLTHLSLYLFHEVLPFWNLRRAQEAVADFRALRLLAVQLLLNLPHVVVGPLIGLWWFMLLMTNIYFHSVGEKFVGLMFGFVAVAVVYYAPRWLQSEKGERETE